MVMKTYISFSKWGEPWETQHTLTNITHLVAPLSGPCARQQLTEQAPKLYPPHPYPHAVPHAPQGQRMHLVKLFECGADHHRTINTGRLHGLTDLNQIALELRKIKVAMRVCEH